MEFGVYLQGHKDLIRRMEALGRPSTQNRIMRPAVNVALTPIKRAAKAKCPRDTGLLRKSIQKKVKAYPRGAVWGGVGPAHGYKTVGEDGRVRNPINYAHLVELGTVTAPARPFLRPALDANRDTALRILADKVEDGLHKEASRKR